MPQKRPKYTYVEDIYDNSATHRNNKTDTRNIEKTPKEKQAHMKYTRADRIEEHVENKNQFDFDGEYTVFDCLYHFKYALHISLVHDCFYSSMILDSFPSQSKILTKNC